MEDTLVERMRGRIEAGYWPRLHCLLLVALASAAAFLLSVTLLALHVHSMAVRYGVAAVGGYVAFLLLIRAWVRWKWSRLVPDPDLDLVNISGDLPLSLPSRREHREQQLPRRPIRRRWRIRVLGLAARVFCHHLRKIIIVGRRQRGRVLARPRW